VACEGFGGGVAGCGRRGNARVKNLEKGFYSIFF